MKIVFFICLFLQTSFAMAQITPATPIDGGLGWLLAAGGAYGVKRYIDYKKKK